MPIKTKAAILDEAPGKLSICEIDVDDPAPNEVRLRTAAAGVCHSDLHFMQGKYPHPLPAVLGHESAGVIDAVGSAVTGLAPGDHVITCLSVFCGSCEFCMSGKPQLCRKERVIRPAGAPPRLSRGGQPLAQFLNSSSFAGHMLVHEHAVVKITDRIPLRTATLIGCGVTTGIGAVLNTAGVKPGEVVAVVGCGGIGLNAIQGAAIAGAGRIIAVDTSAAKLAMATEFGATDRVDATAVDPVEAVLELTGGGVHHSFEAIGLPRTVEQSFDMLDRGGTATVIGMVPAGQKVELSGAAFLQERRIQGSTMGSNRFRIDMPRYIDMYLAGKLKLDELISDTLPLEEINTAYETLGSGSVARQLITFD